MAKRDFNYYSRLIFRHYVCGLPATLLDLLGLCFCPFQLVKGIRVVDPTKETRPYFINAVACALDLLAQSDAIRFRRIEESIRIIANAATAKFASCSGPPLRICSVNFRRFYDPRFEKTVKWLASALVYGATYHHVIERGVVPDKLSERRIADLRVKEAKQFLERVGMTDSPFDVAVEMRAGWSLLKAGINEIRDLLDRDPAVEAALWKKQLEDAELELR
jgi:hypothetical protein